MTLNSQSLAAMQQQRPNDGRGGGAGGGLNLAGLGGGGQGMQSYPQSLVAALSSQQAALNMQVCVAVVCVRNADLGTWLKLGLSLSSECDLAQTCR
jgi:hypothetical protein